MSVAAYIISQNRQLVYGHGHTVQLGVLRACNRPVIEYVVSALCEIRELSKIYVIVSDDHIAAMQNVALPLQQMYQVNIEVISHEIVEMDAVNHQELFCGLIKTFDFEQYSCNQRKSIVINLNNFYRYDFKELLRVAVTSGVACVVVPRQQSSAAAPERYTFLRLTCDTTFPTIMATARWPTPQQQHFDFVDLQSYAFVHDSFPIQKMCGFHLEHVVSEQSVQLSNQQWNTTNTGNKNIILAMRPGAVKHRGLYADISQLLEMFTLNTLILRMTSWNGNCLSDDVIVGPQSVLESCSIGAGTTVGERCRLIECVLEDGVQIGDGVRAKRCYISQGGHIEPYGVYENYFLAE